jgi:hypothetical protein
MQDFEIVILSISIADQMFVNKRLILSLDFPNRMSSSTIIEECKFGNAGCRRLDDPEHCRRFSHPRPTETTPSGSDTKRGIIIEPRTRGRSPASDRHTPTAVTGGSGGGAHHRAASDSKATTAKAPIVAADPGAKPCRSVTVLFVRSHQSFVF